MAHVPDVIYGNRDFRHTPEGTRRVYNRTVKCSKWLLAAVVTTWVVSGLYPIGMIVQRQFSWWPSGVWLGAFSLYGVAMALFPQPADVPHTAVRTMRTDRFDLHDMPGSFLFSSIRRGER